MKPIDYRTATFDQIRQTLVRIRLDVYQSLQEHGPCTTRQLAERSGISILTVRPRVTELVDIGYVILDGGEKTEGIYRALSEFQALRLFETRKAEANQTQLTLF